jgi:DNA-binding XRE family transcriptional regulator
MNRIRTHRISQALSLRELAHFVGIAHTTLARLERGEIDSSIEVKARIARALKVPVTELFPSKVARVR